MRWALAVLICACSGAASASPTPSPTTSPTPSIQVFDPHAFTVRVFYGDDSDKMAALAITDQLPEAWNAATGRRSVVRMTTETPEVYVFIGDEPPARVAAGVQSAWFFLGAGLRFAYIHRGVNDPVVVVHELGHLLGATHWTDCAAPPVEIMCALQGSATTFSDRELRAMGL